MNTKNCDYFLLYACCIPVKGAKNSIICDLQRQVYFNIPNVVYEILTKFSRYKINTIKEFFLNEKNNEIDEYFELLVNGEYGFFTDEIINFPELDLSDFYYSGIISNAIIDFDTSSNHDLKKILAELNTLMCESLELRFFESVSWERLLAYLSTTQDSTLRSVEIIIKYDAQVSKEEILSLTDNFARIKKVTIHASPFNECIETENANFFFSRDLIDSEKCCGIVSPWYFITETRSFIESHHYNSCLNRKVGIDKSGNIKNCPSMGQSFGNINRDAIINTVNLPEFRKTWGVTKDIVDTCRDCEFRYICQDCRAYIKDISNDLSKPLKCNYDPYNAQWN
jgi:SPASM domain peptide maturase of grasp-with-spasm system